MTAKSLKALQKNSFLGSSASYLENLYEHYLKNPESVPLEWRHYFQESFGINSTLTETFHSEVQAQFEHFGKLLQRRTGGQTSVNGLSEKISAEGKKNLRLEPSSERHSEKPSQISFELEKKQMGLRALINAYRLLGHLQADIDPLNLRKKPEVPELTLAFYQLSEDDNINTLTEIGFNHQSKTSTTTLKQTLEDLRKIYCGTFAFEFMHIPDSKERVWVQEKVEALAFLNLSTEFKLKILNDLIAAEGLEKFLAAKYPGAKRFSIEGVDSLIVILDGLLSQSGEQGAKECVIGMAHRGRLNVLTNILGKNPVHLFDEVTVNNNHSRTGDVKYHQGFSSNIDTAGGTVHVTLAFNPSHLEIVSPVVCGSVRAKLERRNDVEGTQVFPVIIHGDASFSGQGVVMEILNMSRTRAYGVGGTIHLILNNQIGFTTSDPRDARSTLYCSDIGKMLEIPIIHINADDPEAVFKVVNLALEYRKKFKKDIIIDLIGYRRHGHNEADDPSVTQPEMYLVVEKLPTVLKSYRDKLIRDTVVDKETFDTLTKTYREQLDKGQIKSVLPLNQEPAIHHEFSKHWRPYVTQEWRESVDTNVDPKLFKTLASMLVSVPENFSIHSRVKKLNEERQKMTQGEMPIDWGYGETMAYATLLFEGHSIRLSGEDVRRGTFFHRHAVIHDQKTGEIYTPLSHLSEEQGTFNIYDSLLSEEATLAFEYGFSTTDPRKLVIWEAQFGDFVNGAQVVIDQFICAGEQKWGRMSGLVLLLPHGFEGQGSEHSSARLERFLQLCAEHNMQVCVPSTPAQMFHMLRRQQLRNLRKPLIVLTPKSFLRHKLAGSHLEEFSNSEFKLIIPEIEDQNKSEINRVILCCGKVYYDLLGRRQQKGIKNCPIIRIEQLYPFPEEELKASLAHYKEVKDIIWCQEEPQNQGAWYSSQHHMKLCLMNDQTLRYVGRKPSAAPAVGYHHLHQEQQEALLREALEV